MIFATVGTHQDGFPRFLSALESLDTDDLVVQYGHGVAPVNARLAEPFMSFSRMLELFDAADAVVTHAGVGSILLAIRHGHVPIVVARQRKYGEHVDDHQVELAEQLEARGRVRAVWDERDLAAAVRGVPPRGAAVSLLDNPVQVAVRAALLGA